MAYSLDLRKRVVAFVKAGGSKSEAHRRFKVSLWCVNNWLSRETLEATYSHHGRPRKLDLAELKQHIIDYPDMILRERAEHFGVYINSIWHACKLLNITRKKNSTVHGNKP